MAKKKSVRGTQRANKTPEKRVKRFRAPVLPYRPNHPKGYRPGIGLIGCGGIVDMHLKAYRKAGYHVVAFTDPNRHRAEQRRDAYYPRGRVVDCAEQLLAQENVAVVDIATHPEERATLIQAAIRAGKHVLSQKPFVTDLAVGRKLVNQAKRKGVKLAVNQNGRWAPHVSYTRQAIAAGLLGKVSSVDLSVHWDHNWCAKTRFNTVPHLVLFDFGIHWFDMVHCFFRGQKPREVIASTCRTISQRTKPPLLAQAVIQYAHGQASIIFRGDTCWGAQDRSVVVGTRGTLVSSGPDLNNQTVTLSTDQGVASPRLVTQWFPDGFDGTMSELLSAIQEDREPTNSARDNLDSLALCFAALRSADSGRPCTVSSRGTVFSTA